MRNARLSAFVFAALALAATPVAAAPYSFFNGFETDTAGWTNATRVASGTGGITSSTGGFHATSSTTAFTTFGGYNFGAGNAVPTAFQEYITSIDIFLDVNAGFADNTRFDFSSAINNSLGTHLSDFIFNAGFYGSSDLTGPGAGTNRFVVSASNNSQPGSAFAKNPARAPIAISTTGWYTFQTHFYNDGGVLEAAMSIFDASDTLVGPAWILSNPAHLIAGVGGNRYGWFDYNQIPNLAFDNSSLTTVDAAAVPEPASLTLLGLGLAAGVRRRFKRSA